MKVGLFTEFSYPGKSERQTYAEVLEQIAVADELGYEFFSTTEGYGKDEFSCSPFPLGLYVAAAQRSRKIRFLTGIISVPVHHPAILASEIAAAETAYFAERYDDFDRRLAAAEQRWDATMAPYRGAELVTYHRSWPNFMERFGLEVIGYVEPRPGIPPSPLHIIELIGEMKNGGVRLIDEMRVLVPPRGHDSECPAAGGDVD